jgi:membrane protease YdiL (CAAX protease family)
MALIPAVVFSLTHLTNYGEMSSVGSLLSQVLLTVFFGIFTGAVYLRTGNIWPLIIAHSLHDILGFSTSAGVVAMGVTEFPDWTTGYLFVIEAALAVCGLYMLRKSKRAEIIELWNRKWSRLNNEETQ